MDTASYPTLFNSKSWCWLFFNFFLAKLFVTAHLTIIFFLDKTSHPQTNMDTVSYPTPFNTKSWCLFSFSFFLLAKLHVAPSHNNMFLGKTIGGYTKSNWLLFGHWWGWLLATCLTTQINFFVVVVVLSKNNGGFKTHIANHLLGEANYGCT